MDMKSELEKLKQQERELLAQLRINNSRQKELYGKMFTEKTGIGVGTRIRYRDMDSYTDAVVRELPAGVYCPMWVSKIKPNGTVTNTFTCIHFFQFDDIEIIKQ